MKRVIVILTIVAMLALAGCDEMFTFNAFDGMGAPEYPKTPDDIDLLLAQTDGDTRGTIDAVKDLASSPTFWDDVASLPDDEKAAVVDSLTAACKDIYKDTSDAVTPLERAEAAVLVAEIYLNSNEEAQAAVNTVAEIALGALDDPTAISSVEDVIVDLLESAFGTGEDLTAALDALSQAGEAYEVFGYTLPADLAITLGYEADRRVAVMSIGDDEFNYGEIGQKAAVAIAIKIFLENYVNYYSDPITDQAQILAIVQNLDAVAPLGGTNRDLINDLMADFRANDALMRILGAMGLDSLLENAGGV